MTLAPLPVPLPQELHARAAGWLGAACGRTGCDLTPNALLALCEARHAQMIGVFDGPDLVAAGVTQVCRHENGLLTCWVLSLGGHAAGPWSAVIAAVEAGAARLGCTTVEFIGRRGWLRLLPEYVATPCETGTHFLKTLEAPQ